MVSVTDTSELALPVSPVIHCGVESVSVRDLRNRGERCWTVWSAANV